MSVVETANFTIPSDPATRKAIYDAMSEISKSYTRQEAERDFVKEAISECAEKSGVPKPILRKLSRSMHKGNVAEEVGKTEAMQELHYAIVNGDGQNQQ